MTTKKDEIWTTKDGTRIAVGDMSEEHVRNTLRYLLRCGREKVARALEEDEFDSDAAILESIHDPYGSSD